MALSIFILLIFLLLNSCSKSSNYEALVEKTFRLMKEEKYELLIEELLSININDESYDTLIHLLSQAPPQKLLPVISNNLNSNIDLNKKKTLIILFKWKLINHMLNYYGGSTLPQTDEYFEKRKAWLEESDSYKKLPRVELYEKLIDEIIEIAKNSELSTYDHIILILYYANTEKGMELYSKMVDKCSDTSISMIFQMLDKSDNPEKLDVLKKLSLKKDNKVSSKAKELLKEKS